MAQTSETIQTGKINIMNPANSILFLGTCAANFSPLLQNRFKNCFDKNARRSSCVLINGRYLIDCGIHCMESIAIAGVNTDAITDLFLTHTHADHFIAQHATGCCCRGCFEKWHHIPAGRALTPAEQNYAVAVVMEWLRRQMQG